MSQGDLVVGVVGGVGGMSGVADGHEGIECGIHHLKAETGNQVGKQRTVVVREERI